jgi:hypothetical protein
MPIRESRVFSGAEHRIRRGDRIQSEREGAMTMQSDDSAGAAVLVQTIFLKDGRLQGILGERAAKSPEAAMEFLKPFYQAALAMIAGAAVAQET